MKSHGGVKETQKHLRGRWHFWLTLIPFLLIWACSPEQGTAESDDEPAATPTPAAVSTTVTATLTLPTVPSTDDPMALNLPHDLQVDGTCNINVFREDETGTTWLMVCAGFDPIGQPAVLRGMEHSAHFRYLVDEDRERVGVLFETLKLAMGGCVFPILDFVPFEVPITDDVVVYEASIELSGACEGALYTYQVTWQVETGAISIDGLLEATS